MSKVAVRLLLGLTLVLAGCGRAGSGPPGSVAGDAAIPPSAVTRAPDPGARPAPPSPPIGAGRSATETPSGTPLTGGSYGTGEIVCPPAGTPAPTPVPGEPPPECDLSFTPEPAPPCEPGQPPKYLGIGGCVRDARGRRIVGAGAISNVMTPGVGVPNISIVTDAGGRYDLFLHSGRYRITISADGYEPASRIVELGAVPVAADFVLVPEE